MLTDRGPYAVLGLSTFGRRVAIGLFDRGATVVAVDRDDATVQAIAPKVTRAFRADALDVPVLRHLGVLEATTVVIGFRRAFEATVLLAHQLRQAAKPPRIVAQVDTEEKEQVLRLLGVDVVVFPERDTADRTVRRLLSPDLLEEMLISTDASVVEITVPGGFVGQSLSQLNVRSRFGVHVLAIKHPGTGGEKAVVVAPSPDAVFRGGDTMVVVGAREKIQAFLDRAD